MMKYLPLLLTLPLVASAQVPRDAFELMGLVASWFVRIIPVLLGVIVIIIFWNLGQFILHAGDEREREKYKQFMVWGVVSMFLIFGFWGLVYFISNSFFGNISNPVLGNPEYVDKNGMPVF